MRALHVFLIILAQFTGVNRAITVTLSNLVTRAGGATCANSAKTIAGTMLHRRNPEPSNHLYRADTGTILWCAHNSATYVIFTVAHALSTEEVINILHGVYGLCLGMIGRYGDGTIAGGTFLWPGLEGLELLVRNANNHQITYGVMGAAMSALEDYMGQHGSVAGFFSIYDGVNRVGEGSIGFGL